MELRNSERKHTDRPSKIDGQDYLHFLRKLRGKNTAAMVRDELRLDFGVMRVQQLLNNTQFFDYMKRTPAPRLTVAH